ncbi:SDR family NAD(P)-dependent oxidoreductase [Rhizorhabdus wittichii]|uniref:Short-chain dehydrogenase/reductase SDR n=2 Tax=Rhizorhabdus wittichii TaxID=160791 RepID=A0A9J9H866_RHIWR|nr:SDR family oxidoreductase [Rhizorhabdus wittichii]ABQ66750.1 short-chain dehydrogenase/reductase SDR [Rhizorhabdus wittichii RW1]QTH22698.1 SDR family oxidoreductase [Rhizorhabdus wittichii]
MTALFSLEGRTAMVTGASRGLGRAIALGLADAGASLILAARDAAKLGEVADEVRAKGRDARIVTFDLADMASVEAAARGLVDEGAPIDILVNNGGIAEWGPLHGSSLDHWERTFDVNVSAIYLLCRELSKPMAERGWGRIINFASYVAETGRPNLSAYVASKHAVLGLTRAVAADLAPHGVTCNAIAPGIFLTDMAAPTAGHPQRAKIFRDAIAIGRFGDPAEIVGPVQFLASEASRYVTGHMLPVDGGIANILSLPVVVEGGSLD